MRKIEETVEQLKQLAPEQQREVGDFVAFLASRRAGSERRERGRRMAEALERVAAAGGLGIENAAEWERDERKDRELPGRGE